MFFSGMAQLWVLLFLLFLLGSVDLGRLDLDLPVPDYSNGGQDVAAAVAAG